MKTIHEYEPSDINIGGVEGVPPDPVHLFLFTSIMRVAFGGLKPQDGEPEDFGIKRIIADILNSAQKQGITIAKTESVPEVFRS